MYRKGKSRIGDFRNMVEIKLDTMCIQITIDIGVCSQKSPNLESRHGSGLSFIVSKGHFHIMYSMFNKLNLQITWEV